MWSKYIHRDAWLSWVESRVVSKEMKETNIGMWVLICKLHRAIGTVWFDHVELQNTNKWFNLTLMETNRVVRRLFVCSSIPACMILPTVITTRRWRRLIIQVCWYMCYITQWSTTVDSRSLLEKKRSKIKVIQIFSWLSFKETRHTEVVSVSTMFDVLTKPVIDGD